MPPLVARQWNVLTGSRTAAAHVHCYLRIPRLAEAYALRPYTQESTNHGGDSKLRTSNSAIIVPASILNTQPENLIAHIKPVAKRRLTQDRFAVFLVTPYFAQWLLDDTKFLQKALSRAYRHMLESNKLPYARVHALCAVVDKLPNSTPIVNTHDLAGEALTRTTQPPIAEPGLEGMTYATLPFSDSLPAEDHSSSDNAAITFVSSEGSASDGYFGDTLRLPLANTVFQTGSLSTMTYSTWETVKGAGKFTLKSKRNVNHHGIKIHTGGASNDCVSSLAIPLLPLTFPRQVDASMGNILRRVIGPDGKSITASTELEQVVPRYYHARGQSSQATTVWALVVSKESLKPVLEQTNALLGRLSGGEESGDYDVNASTTDDELWQALWKRKPPLWNELVPRTLAAGGRLHRVLSGGGGWGKKAGLLSLDPVATMEDVDSLPASWHDEGPGDLSSALQQVAHDGDFIQFFISPSSSFEKSRTLDSHLDEWKASNSDPWAWELGTIPSTMDSIPGTSWQHDNSASEDVFVVRKSFGALSEGGMTISRQFKLGSKDAFSLVGGSKVDVPFSRFSAVNIGEEDLPAEEDSINNVLEAKPLPYHSVLVRRLYGEESPALLRLPSLSPHIEIDYMLASSPEPFTEALEKPSSASSSPVAKSKSPATRSKIPRSVSDKTENKPLKRSRVQSDSAPSNPSQKTHNLILHPNSSPEKLNSVHFNYKVRDTMQAMHALVKEYRELIVDYRRHTDQTGLSTAPQVKMVRSTRRVPMLQQSQRRLDLDHNRGAPPLAKERRNTVVGKQSPKDTTRKQSRDTVTEEVGLDLANVVAHLNAQMESILANTQSKTRIDDIVNTSATDVYNLHISLRWRLGLMIRARQRHRHPHPMARSLMPLEKKLVKLRGHTDNLYYDHPELSQSIVRETLSDMENDLELIKDLKLSEAAQRVEKFNKLSSSEQAKIRENTARRRALKDPGLEENPKIRKVMNKLIILEHDWQGKDVFHRVRSTVGKAHPSPEQSSRNTGPLIRKLLALDSRDRARQRHVRRYRPKRTPVLNKQLGEKLRLVPAGQAWRRELAVRSAHRFRHRRAKKITSRRPAVRSVIRQCTSLPRQHISAARADRIRKAVEARKTRKLKKSARKEELLSKVSGWLDGGDVKSSTSVDRVFGIKNSSEGPVSFSAGASPKPTVERKTNKKKNNNNKKGDIGGSWWEDLGGKI